MNRNENLKIHHKIIEICKNEYKSFLKKANVVGVALGYKRIKGFNTWEKCITVFVVKKITRDKITHYNMIPPNYKGIKTDVIESGIIKKSSLTKRIRPALGGYSIGAIGNLENGTLGGLVADDTDIYILSNNHVLAYENTIPLGSSIVQPGVSDGGIESSDTVAKLSKYIPLQFETVENTSENYVDCAIAKITKKNLVSSKIAFVGTPKGKALPVLNENVVKVGRTTEESYGKIINIGATITIVFDKGKAVFKNQITTTKMAQSGDSGSLLINAKRYVVGMAFGNSQSISLFNSIDGVLDGLNVTLMTK